MGKSPKEKQATVHNSKNWQAEKKAGIGTLGNLVGNEGMSWYQYYQSPNGE